MPAAVDMKALLGRLNFELALYPDPEPARVSFDLTPTEARALFEAAGRDLVAVRHEALTTVEALKAALGSHNMGGADLDDVVVMTRALNRALLRAVDSFQVKPTEPPQVAQDEAPVLDEHDDSPDYVEKCDCGKPSMHDGVCPYNNGGWGWSGPRPGRDRDEPYSEE